MLIGESKPDAINMPDTHITMAGSPLGVAAGFLYGYQWTPAFEFMPEIRRLGAGFTKIYLFWEQLEPEKGRYDWSAVDKFVEQLGSPDEGLISIFSSSLWATKRPSNLLPPSPANDTGEYYRLIFNLVKHCSGRVRFWQNDCEPNNPVFWSGSKEEFVTQLKVFYTAVKDADPSGIVVVGGYDGLFGPPGTYQFPNQQAGLDFFDYVLSEGPDAFDLFDLRLYGDPYTVETRVDFMRQKMLAKGYSKPIVCTEYGGPNLFEFAENRKYIPMVASWTREAAAGDPQAVGESTKNPIKQLYDGMANLAPQTQMFMEGCSGELEAKYQRIQSRSIVMRNIFAFAAGVQKTIYWALPRTQLEGDARLHIMALMYGKIGLLELRAGEVKQRFPSGDAFERMAVALRGVKEVKRVEVAGRSDIFLFEVDRHERESCFVVWQRRDAFSGEDDPPVSLQLPWPHKAANALDILGNDIAMNVTEKTLEIDVSLTPIFIERGG